VVNAPSLTTIIPRKYESSPRRNPHMSELGYTHVQHHIRITRHVTKASFYVLLIIPSSSPSSSSSSLLSHSTSRLHDPTPSSTMHSSVHATYCIHYSSSANNTGEFAFPVVKSNNRLLLLLLLLLQPLISDSTSSAYFSGHIMRRLLKTAKSRILYTFGDWLPEMQ